MTVGYNEQRFEFLGLYFHNFIMEEALRCLEEFITRKEPRMVFTPTAELIVQARKNAWLQRIYNSSDLLLIDSFVVYYFARISGKPVRAPVSAARLMLNFLPLANQKGYHIYLLGATEEVVTKTVEVIKNKFPRIHIAGWHNGYFDIDRCPEVINDIKRKRVDVLFVGMSSPFKERFISQYYKKIGVPVSIGVGGTFDIIAGKCKLAPSWVSRLGIEWLYRLLQEPRRLYKRYLFTNTWFVILWLKNLLISTEEQRGGKI